MTSIIQPIIQEDLLIHFGAEHLTLKKNEILFREGNSALFYNQVIEGEMKMFNLSQEGKEFVQGIFGNRKSFGEPPLIGNFNYPASASATMPTTLLRLNKSSFLTLLKSDPEIHLRFTALMANRLAYKAMIGKEVSVHPPEHRILTLLKYLKNENGSDDFIVGLTRQQIAELTGLRVETVIRAIKKMEREKILRLENHKIIM